MGNYKKIKNKKVQPQFHFLGILNRSKRKLSMAEPTGLTTHKFRGSRMAMFFTMWTQGQGKIPTERMEELWWSSSIMSLLQAHLPSCS